MFLHYLRSFMECRGADSIIIVDARSVPEGYQFHGMERMGNQLLYQYRAREDSAPPTYQEAYHHHRRLHRPATTYYRHDAEEAAYAARTVDYDFISVRTPSASPGRGGPIYANCACVRRDEEAEEMGWGPVVPRVNEEGEVISYEYQVPRCGIHPVSRLGAIAAGGGSPEENPYCMMGGAVLREPARLAELEEEEEFVEFHEPAEWREPAVLPEPDLLREPVEVRQSAGLAEPAGLLEPAAD